MHNMCLVRPAFLCLNVHVLKVFYEQINYYTVTMINISLALKGNTQLHFVLALSSSPLNYYYINRDSHVSVCLDAL